MNFYSRKSFFLGFISSVFIMGAYTWGVPGLSSLKIFTPQTVISSADINKNFELLTGSLLFKGTISNSLTFNESSMISNSTNCNLTGNPGHCFKNRLEVNDLYIDDPSKLINKSTYPAYYTGSGSYHIYKITESGWYEITVISNSSISATNTCSVVNCNASASVNFTLKVYKLDGSDEIQGESIAALWSGASFNQNDSDGDATFNEPLFKYNSGELGTSQKYYLKAGMGVAFELDGNKYTNNASTTFTFNLPADSIKFKIVRKYDEL